MSNDYEALRWIEKLHGAYRGSFMLSDDNSDVLDVIEKESGNTIGVLRFDTQ